MAARKDTLFEQFVAPIVRLFIDEPALKQFYERVDWECQADRFRNSDLVYPDYYVHQNYHGIEGGYLAPGAAVSYDPITQYAILPNETWVRQALVERVQGQPRRILDLGCGTGSTTLLLKQSFPEAEVIGLDLSPYMLFMADYKAQETGLTLELFQKHAAETGFPDASFDLVTASLLFHETPPTIARQICQEAYRLLRVGGQILVLDGNQETLRQLNWLHNLFEEPYIHFYAAGSLDAWMGAAGFGAVKTDSIWGLNQLSQGVKPLSLEDRDRSFETDLRMPPEGLPALA